MAGGSQSGIHNQALEKRGNGEIRHPSSVIRHPSFAIRNEKMSVLVPIIRLRYAFAARYRRRRFELVRLLLQCADARGWWLDLGGGAGSYFLETMSAHGRVILLDVDEGALRAARARFPRVQCLLADGQALPFKDGALALIFCNSVIEHVPYPERLASEIRRTAQQYFVQTPHAGFPLESHAPVPLPFYRHMPRVVQRWLCSLVGASYAYLSSVNYLSEQDLRRYFPDACILRERAFWLTKSFYVVKGAVGGWDRR